MSDLRKLGFDLIDRANQTLTSSEIKLLVTIVTLAKQEDAPVALPWLRLEALTGLSQTPVSLAMRRLQERKILQRHRQRNGNQAAEYMINWDWQPEQELEAA